MTVRKVQNHFKMKEEHIQNNMNSAKKTKKQSDLPFKARYVYNAAPVWSSLTVQQ